MTRVIIVVRAAIGLAAAAVAAGCNTPQVSANTRTGAQDDSSEQVMFGARAVLAASGVRRGEVLGDTVSTFDAATRFEFHGVHAAFTTTLGRPLGTLTARAGTYRMGTSVFDSHGKVTIVSDTSGRRLEGTTVKYDVTQNRLSSDSPFVATSSGRRLSGIGFTADPGLFTVKCLQKCSGSLGQ
jgi:LPS export ABC transporter protein LptC